MNTTSVSAAALILGTALSASAQVTTTDYQRAQALRQQYESAAPFLADPPTWVSGTHRFYYRRTLADGHEFVMVDADTRTRQPAFDHSALAASLSRASGRAYTSTRLPFQTFAFNEALSAIDMTIAGARWTCTLADYACHTPEAPAPGEIRRGITGPVRGELSSITPRPRMSPDGKWMAFIDNYNVAIRPFGGDKRIALSSDGSEGQYYDGASIVWSPDSSKIAAYRVRPGYRRLVHYIASSPEDQLQPEHWAAQYAKPGDLLDLEQPVLFDVRSQKQIIVDTKLFPNPYDLSDLVWRKDSRAFTFEYNQRGHEIYRVVEVDAHTGAARAIVSEEPKTFFYYNRSAATLQAGKRFRHDLADGKEVIWMSERDGWNHLYLLDGATGKVKQQITKGAWPVRHVVRVDEDNRRLWFSAGGIDAGKDPYFQHYFRINFDGSGLTRLTTVDANHTVEFSSDLKYMLDHYSRVDMPPVLELIELSTGAATAGIEIERGDATALVKTGWRAPEVFVAKGRDGVTDIWGLVWKPARFEASKKYPVIEYIYAGPHGTHTPKSFSAYSAMQAQAELGFIVVQMDGMGTSNRSKAFHDVAWQNIRDGGFPDRILWHKAFAAQNAWYDITRVGIYGGSAGGQNAMGALLFHPDFYKAAVSYAGCHDNRMDKIWWNEQWMGWPIGPQYAASSNVDHAHLLQGKLLLMVGELDTNVDPASTMQVVNALIKADKNFDLLIYPGEDHNAGRGGQYADYGERKRFDFFVRHLLGQNPPEWSAPAAATSTQQ
ncbi:MAG TPA: DPP IV N-terminal domain-containing protein [Vicinamibacterales bacterium]|nr:DPP IV N-terminal domain-containing protein [Vicinamibacterales bacterium]